MCAVLEAIREQAVGDHFSRVHRVSMAVGALCNVEVEALVFCFDIVMQGTIADGAVLDIVSVPGTGCCQRCQHTFSCRITGRAMPVLSHVGGGHERW